MRKFYKFIASAMLVISVNHSFGQTIWSEDFSTATGTTPPSGWANNDLTSSGLLWAFDNPAGRTINSPFSDPVAILDSDDFCTADEETHLVTPVVNLSSYTGNIFLQFDHYFRSGWGGAYSVEVYNGTTWTSVLSGSGTSTANPQTELIDISTASGLSASTQIRFKWTGECSWYWFLDNISVKQISCYSPTALTSTSTTLNTAGLSWTAGDSETDWNIEWGTPGFTPGTGAEIGSDAVSTTPAYTINGLTASTSYHVYVQADCGAGDLSDWAGPFVVYTGHCTVSTTNTGDYTSAFSTTNALTNVTYSATAQPSGSYANQTSQSFVAIPSSVINFSHSYVGGSNGINIWVDWNNNLIFDSGENVFTLANSNATKTGTITVPPGTAAGTYRLRVRSDFGSTANPPACGNVSYGTTIDYTLTVVDAPVSPTPTQEAGVPNCTDGTDLTVTGTPGTNETWYWQTTATGTSTANNATTPWTVYQNGTYYVRTYNSVYNLWSAASSVVVSNVPTAPTPPTPLAAQNPACTPGTEISVSTAPTGIVYYWQGTSNSSSSTTDNASAPYTVTATGTYYVKAFETATGCWSDPEGILVTVDSFVPAAPTANPAFYAFCSSDSPMDITVQAPVVSGTCTVTNNASGLDGSAVTATVNNFSCAQGAITAATMNATIVSPSTNSWCSSGWYSYNIIVNGTTVATDQCNLTNFNLVPYLPLTSVSIVSNDDDGDPGDQVTLTVTVNLSYSNPTPTISWYDAATAGNNLGSGTTLNALGTTVLPTAIVGEHEFYAESASGGCASASRTLITVNVNDVNVVLSAVDASCNNGNDGSFTVTDTLCGVAPFTYAVDGGAFGPIPSDLTAGSHTVVVRDANADESAAYTIVVGSPAGPSDVEVTSILNDQVVIVWNANGSETEWNIEWGLPGFTPGTGTEIGSATSQDTTYTITGLDGSTEYDIYVSANCGAGTTTGDWDSVNVTTDCDPIAALNFCENFEDINALGCWKAIDANEDGETWQVYLDEDYANSGEQFVAIYTDGFAGDNDDYFVLPRMTLTGNEVLSFAYRAMDASEPNDFRIVLSTTDPNPASFTNVVYEDTVSNETYQNATVNLSAYTGDVYIAFHVPAGGLDGWYLFIDDVCIDICTPNPGTDGTLSVCRTQGTVDLNTVITSEYTHGTWSYAPLSGVVNGSTMNVSVLTDGTYPVNYIVNAACTSDTTVATITIVSPSSAGNNGLLSVCKNQMIDLFGALSGNVDFGGTWYAPNGTPMTSSYFQTGTLAGQSVYKYIVSNGVCGADTAEVTVDISNCDFLGLDDVTLLDNVSIAPNPNHGQFQIIGIPGADFTFEVLDLNGRVVRSSAKITSSITNVNLTDVENGVYMVRIVGNDSEKMMRVIKQ